MENIDISKLRQSDNQEWSKLTKYYQRRMAGWINRQWAKAYKLDYHGDIIQESLLGLWQFLQRGNRPDNLGALLRSIVERKTITLRNKTNSINKREFSHKDTEEKEAPIEPVDPEPGPEQKVISEEIKKAYYKGDDAISKIPDQKPGPEQILISKDIKKAYYECLGKEANLTNRQKICFHLHFRLQFSYQEIAGLITSFEGININWSKFTVVDHVKAGQKKMVNCLEKKGF